MYDTGMHVAQQRNVKAADRLSVAALPRQILSPFFLTFALERFFIFARVLVLDDFLAINVATVALSYSRPQCPIWVTTEGQYCRNVQKMVAK
jgi:hypothetical protein